MHSIIRDSATFGNLLAFVIYREYITALKDLPRLGENDQHKFYMFLININQVLARLFIPDNSIRSGISKYCRDCKSKKFLALHFQMPS